MKEILWKLFLCLLESYHGEGFLFENNRQALQENMIKVGLTPKDAQELLHELQSLKCVTSPIDQSSSPHSKETMRIYTPEECSLLTPAARNCLLQLERAGVIDTPLRELIIDQAIELEAPMIDVSDIRGITYPLLFSASHHISTDKQLLAVLMLSGNESIQH